MSDERWQRLKRVFHGARELAAGARGAFLDRECAGDAELRAEVEELLASHAEADGFLSRPAMADALGPAPPALEGRRIGAYRILGEIGRGGMGVVYRAVRDDDAFQKTVALKVVRGQGGWGDVEGRLERERQILARLQHPNIAAVFDGGTTDGRPALPGDGARRGTAHHRVLRGARPRDARAACDGPRGVRRRPVRAPEPGRPSRPQARATSWSARTARPKLLDFGIAKLLAAGVDPDLAPTATLLPMMTPEYASPEQVRGEAGHHVERRLLAGRRALRAADRPAPLRGADRLAGGDRPGGLRERSAAAERGRRPARRCGRRVADAAGGGRR